jgi:hypothetical protein
MLTEDVPMVSRYIAMGRRIISLMVMVPWLRARSRLYAPSKAHRVGYAQHLGHLLTVRIGGVIHNVIDGYRLLIVVPESGHLALATPTTSSFVAFGTLGSTTAATVSIAFALSAFAFALATITLKRNCTLLAIQL